MSSMLGPLIYGLSFAWAVRHPEYSFSGLPMFLASVTMMACLALAIWSGRRAARLS
jgi:hypothetical protein